MSALRRPAAMLLFLALVLLPVFPAMGQPPPEGGLTLRTTTRLVHLTVVCATGAALRCGV